MIQPSSLNQNQDESKAQFAY
jgi:hypothetical protein